jgi:hypothetical protein
LPNFLENNPTAPSYIKNKICNIISYKGDNTLLSSKNIELDNLYNTEIELNLQEPLNFYNTYKISIGKYVYENIKYDFVPLTVANQTIMTHILGNLFIFYDEIRRAEESIGVVSESTLKMLKAYPDNGQDILVVLNSNKNQASGTIYRRESKPIEEP